MLGGWSAAGEQSQTQHRAGFVVGGKRANFHGQQQLAAEAGGVGEWEHEDSAHVSWHLVGLGAGSQFRLSGLLQGEGPCL